MNNHIELKFKPSTKFRFIPGIVCPQIKNYDKNEVNWTQIGVMIPIQINHILKR